MTIDAPTGPNNRINPYYAKENHIKLARIDSNRREFFGTIGGDPGIPGLLSKPAIVMQGEATGPYDTGVIIMEQEPVWDGNQISDQWVLQKNGVDILGTENIPEGGTYAIPDASVTEDDVFAILATATYAEDPLSREVQSDALIATIVSVPTLPTINNTSPTVGDTITAAICQSIASNSPLTEKLVEWHDDGPDPVLQQDFLNPSEPLDCTAQFTINATEAGERIRAEMQVQNGVAPLAGAPVRSVSAWTDPVYAGDAPSITGVPTISGTAQLGQVLTANPAPVAGLPSFVRSWQWLRDGVPVSGSTSDSYTLLTADIGAVMTVEQTETNTIGSDSAVSDPTSAVLDGPATNLTPPVATGNTSLGDVLTTTDGTWDNATGGAFSYQWQRGGGPTPTDIPGATSNTYTITLDDDDLGLRCMVTYTKPEGAASAPSNAILVDNFTIPVISGVPTISGSTVVGSVLTAQPSAVAATPASATTWQWHNATDGVIAGATSATYTVQASDSGDRLYVEQIETNALGSDTERSADTDVVTDTFILTVENTSESPDITIPDGADPGLAITFTIAGTPYTTDVDGTTLTIGGIQAAPMCIIKPTISGTGASGQTLTAEAGYYLYAGAETIIFEHEWINDVDGPLGEFGFDYVATATDQGDTISFEASVSGNGFAAFKVSSDSFGPIAGEGIDSLADLFSGEIGFAYEAAFDNTFENTAATDPAEVGDNVLAFVDDANGVRFEAWASSVSTLTDAGGGFPLRLDMNGTNSKLSNNTTDLQGQNGIGLIWFGQINSYIQFGSLIMGDETSAANFARYFQFRLNGNSGGNVGFEVIGFDKTVAPNALVGTSPPDTVPLNTDVLLMANITLTEIELFYNGASVGSGPNPSGTLSGPGTQWQTFSVGSRANGANVLDGEMHGFSVRNVPWTAQEITDVMNYFGV